MMPHKRFTRAERDMSAGLRHRHTPEAIYKEAKSIDAPRKRAGRKSRPWDPVAIWIAVQVKQNGQPRKGEWARRQISKLFEPRPFLSCPCVDTKTTRVIGDQLSADRIERLCRQVDRRRAIDSEYATLTSSCLASIKALLAERPSQLLPYRLRADAIGWMLWMVPLDDPDQATIVFQSPDGGGNLLLAEADSPDETFTDFQSLKWSDK